MNVYGTISGQITAGKAIGSLASEISLNGEICPCMTVGGELSTEHGISGVLCSEQTLSGVLEIPSAIGVDPYQGDYHITPSRETQTLSTAGKYLNQSIVVEPIPSNYGLITWNGSTLTVS